MMPFDGGATDTANGTLILSVVAAVAYLFVLDRPQGWRRTLVKTLSVALLAVLSFVQGGPMLLTAALILSSIGDACLAQDGEPFFLAGLGSFLAAHLAYVALFVSSTGSSPTAPEIAGMALLVVVTGGVGFLLVRSAGALALPVAGYVAAIAAMGASAVPVGGLALLGALMFMASDTILGFERFRMAPDHRLRAVTAPAVWILYYLGQLAITFAFVLGPSAT